MQNRPSNPYNDYQAVRTAVREEMQPFVERLAKVELRQDASESVYLRRDMAEQVFKDIKDEFAAIKDAIKEQREQAYKLIAAVLGIVTLVVMFGQHISIH